MESWQKQLVTENLPSLINNTTCGLVFLASLRRTGIISQFDQDRILLQRIPSQRAVLLYQLLLDKDGAYEGIIQALEETQQEGALKIFTQTYTGIIEYNIEDVIGKGDHSTTVFNGFLGDQKVAVKVIQLKNADKSYQNYPLQELEVMKKLGDHENILRHYFTEEFQNTLLVAMELCVTSLAKWMYNDSTDETKDEICRQITKGIVYLHKRNMVHRDLKPSNILLTSNGLVKIGDIGLSKRMPSQTSAGKGCWMAPEVLLERVRRTGSNTTSATDIFSMGCIFYYVFTNGDHPFGAPTEQDKNIREYEPQISKIPRTKLISPKLLSLISEMISYQPKERPSAVHTLMLLSKQFNADLLNDLLVTKPIQSELRCKGTSKILMGHLFPNKRAIQLIDLFVSDKVSIWARYFSSLNVKPLHVIAACIHGNFLNLLKLTFEINVYQKEFNDELIHLAMYFGNPSTIAMVFSQYERVTGRNGILVGRRLGEFDITRDEILYTPFKTALIRGDETVIDKVIQMVFNGWQIGGSSVEAYDLLEESAEVGNAQSFKFVFEKYCPKHPTFLMSTFILHKCVKNTLLENAEEIRSRSEIIKILLAFEPNLVNVKFEGKIPMEMDQIHLGILGVISVEIGTDPFRRVVSAPTLVSAPILTFPHDDPVPRLPFPMFDTSNDDLFPQLPFPMRDSFHHDPLTRLPFPMRDPSHADPSPRLPFPMSDPVHDHLYPQLPYPITNQSHDHSCRRLPFPMTDPSHHEPLARLPFPMMDPFHDDLFPELLNEIMKLK